MWPPTLSGPARSSAVPTSRRSIDSGSTSSESGRQGPTSHAAAEEAAAEEGSLQSAVAVHAATAEAGRLADRVHALQRRTVGSQDPTAEVGLQAAERLSSENVQPYGYQRAARTRTARLGIARIKQLVRGHDPDQPIAQEPPCGRRGHHLRILSQAATHLKIAFCDHPVQILNLDPPLTHKLIHSGGEVAYRVRPHEVLSPVQEPLNLRGRTGSQPTGQQPQVLAGQVGVLLGAGQSELRTYRCLVEHKPRVVMAAGCEVAQRTEGVEAWKQRRGKTTTTGIKPERRRSRQDADAVVAPDRSVIDDAFRVVPHPVWVDQPAPRSLGHLKHGAVDVIRHPGDEMVRRVAELPRPDPPHEVEVAADPATGHDHCLSDQMEVADLRLHRWSTGRDVGRGQHCSGDEHTPGADLERTHLVPVSNADSS